jgi:biotin carboxylase
VIKPADRAAGVAVRSVESAVDARRAYREAAHASRKGGAVLAERYLEGSEVSIESIAVEGRQRAICVTDKVVSHEPHFVEVAHAVPSALDAVRREAAVEAALSACAAVGLSWGACHTEVKLTEAGPVVVEVNPRLAGDCIVDLVDLALGLNLYELLGRQALGEEITAAELVPRRYGAAAIHFLTSSPGIFLDATSPLEHEPPDWLIELSITSPSGHRLTEPRSNTDRIGYAIVIGDSGPMAAARARWAIDSVAVRMAEDVEPIAAGISAGPTES